MHMVNADRVLILVEFVVTALALPLRLLFRWTLDRLSLGYHCFVIAIDIELSR